MTLPNYFIKLIKAWRFIQMMFHFHVFYYFFYLNLHLTREFIFTFLCYTFSFLLNFNNFLLKNLSFTSIAIVQYCYLLNFIFLYFFNQLLIILSQRLLGFR